MPVVLLAHGSRHPDGIASIERLRDAVQTTGIEHATAAYLDLNQPDLTAAALDLRDRGHRQAVVAPLLFTPAFHARTDAPSAVRAAEQASGIRLTVADILGTGDDLLPILDAALADAGIGPGELLITSVGSSRPEANAMVADLGGRIAARRGAAVHTGFATSAPRAEDVLAAQPGIVGVLALFVGHGLLLDKINSAAAARGIPVTAPLETRLAPIAAARYRAAG